MFDAVITDVHSEQSSHTFIYILRTSVLMLLKNESEAQTSYARQYFTRAVLRQLT